MNSKLVLKILSLAAMIVLFANCSARNITTEANPFLDPNPVINITTKTGADPRAKEQWNLVKTGVSTANRQDGSRRIQAALLGTGVDYTHEDLAPNIFVNRKEWTELTPGQQNPMDHIDGDGNDYVDDFIGYDFVENDGLPFDRNGAGTAMAGVLGAATNNGVGISGVVPDISIVPVRFIDADGTMLLPNLFKALNYALNMKVDVILLHTPSYVFGSTSPPARRAQIAKLERDMLRNVLGEIKKAGIPVVASAGNTGSVVEGQDSLSVELAQNANVILVTSVDEKDVRPFIANFSRERVHTSAPGKDVLTTAPGNRYVKVSSTAVAAAHVAGALALGINQTYGRIEMRKLLEAVIKPEASDAVENLKYETIGGNRLNVAKYLSYIGK